MPPDEPPFARDQRALCCPRTFQASRRASAHIASFALLGRGGMGAVYLAEQSEPVRREVAIKLLTNGVDSEIFAARFDAERQTLALMQHPNITSVFDAGVSEAGLPYFVMERVSGTTLLEFCDSRRLGVKARIDLFRQICHAVQHAHQKGIVHRDLKPSNVIVTEADGKPVCKVIDFGIAKTIGGAEAAKLTMTGISLGTPAYMSPEQARGDADVDTRADVYSLGVTALRAAGRRPAVRLEVVVRDDDGDAARRRQRAEPALCIAASRGASEPSPSGGAPTRRRFAASSAKISIGSCSRRSSETASCAITAPTSSRPIWRGISPTSRYRSGRRAARIARGSSFGGTGSRSRSRRRRRCCLSASRSRSRIQARRIAAARNAVVRRQGQAEELIGFMLGDLRTRLTAVGRLELLDEVSKKAMDYFAAVPETELSNEELFRRSQALSQLGEVRYNQGKLDTAFTAFKQSLALAESLARRDSTERRLAARTRSQPLLGRVHPLSRTTISIRRWRTSKNTHGSPSGSSHDRPTASITGTRWRWRRVTSGRRWKRWAICAAR